MSHYPETGFCGSFYVGLKRLDHVGAEADLLGQTG